ncbi:MAG TPA: hypothetical protein VJQ56_10150, partial [Blastocatellia bacterium]|nr:hypothetical protein [Blastocatellia bacterium]
MVKLVSLLVVASLSSQVFAYQSQKSSASSADAEHKSRAEERALRLQRATTQVQDFAARALEFENAQARTVTVAGLADALWKVDEPYARKLFLKAYETLKPIGASDARATKQNREQAESSYLREQLLARIACRDPEMARRLVEREAESVDKAERVDSSEVFIASALDLAASKPDEALHLAERSLRGGVSRAMIDLLNILRKKDEPAANNLFLKTLARFTAQPVVKIDDLVLLGTYVLTAPVEGLPPDGIMMTSVGGVMTYNITGNRPGVPAAVLRAYLDAAVNILVRPVADPKQKRLSYVAGYQLLPKVRQFLPERAQALNAAMCAMISEIPHA